MHERLRILRISCMALPPTAVHPEAAGTWGATARRSARFCEEFLGNQAQADALGELAGSGADERHAVITTHGQLGLHTAVDLP